MTAESECCAQEHALCVWHPLPKGTRNEQPLLCTQGSKCFLPGFLPGDVSHENLWLYSISETLTVFDFSPDCSLKKKKDKS